MKKTFTENGLYFEIAITLNAKLERCINGNTFHIVNVFCTSPKNKGLLSKYEVNDKTLKSDLENIIEKTKYWANNKDKKTEAELILEELGFTK